ncbi:MAG: hypothetical protein QOE62_2466 [Actinomycetota bacterium]|nr:hypothetical protein [Actinomycetota bacterium]
MGRLRVWFWDSHVARMRLLVFGVVLAATAVKLILAATTQGTNDVFNWAQFGEGVRRYGPIDIYGHRFRVGTHLFPIYNHPPLMGWMLVLFNKLDDLGIPFRFMIRVPATLADIVTTMLVFELVRSRRSLLQATIAGVMVASSPALIIVSGFHGNTDPVFLMLTFLSFSLLVNNRSATLAGLAYAFAMSVKIVPIVALPLLLLLVARSGRRRLYEFLGSSSVVFVVLWIPVLVKRWTPFKADVLGFKGYPGKWGLVEIATKLGASKHAIATLEGSGRTVLLVVAATIPVLLLWKRPSATNEAFGLTFVLILLLSTATGGRYLVWAVAAAFLIDVWAAVVYNVAASALLIIVYDRWSNALPWHWDRAHASDWVHREVVIAGIAWLALLAVALLALRALWDHRPTPEDSPDLDSPQPADLSPVG